MSDPDSFTVKVILELFSIYRGVVVREEKESPLLDYRMNQAVKEFCEKEPVVGHGELVLQLWEQVSELAALYESDFSPIREDPTYANSESREALSAKYQSRFAAGFGLGPEEAKRMLDELYVIYLLS